MILEIVYIVVAIVITFLTTALVFARRSNRTHLALLNEKFDYGCKSYIQGWDAGHEYVLGKSMAAFEALKNSRQ